MLIPKRRDFICSLTASAVATQVSFLRAQDAPYTSREDIDTWMMSTRATQYGLNLFRFRDPMYCLTQSIKWLPEAVDPRHLPIVEVPTGFVTDFTSVPRVFWTALPRDGVYAFAAIIHDYLYWEQKLTRADADTILALAMRDLKVGTLTRTAIYDGVRVGGWWAWDSNAKLKLDGERRVLSRWPKDAVTNWSDWKKQSDVFR